VLPLSTISCGVVLVGLCVSPLKKQAVRGCGVDSAALDKSHLVGCFEHGNEPLVSC
jgi:hypothetical protein